MEMVRTIKTKLEEIGTDHKVKILHACETGSRGWGFPSPDSDFDVRFIYMHDPEWYLQLNEVKDSIEVTDGELDITGWDLRKCLKLLKKSNAPLLERFTSPLVYYKDAKFSKEFIELMGYYYSPIAVFYHHYSLASKFYADLKNKEHVKLKSYFYLLRSLLSCNWIINDAGILPMAIDGLMKYTDHRFRKIIGELISVKATVGEKYLHPRSAEMTTVIEGLFSEIENQKSNLSVNNSDYSKLNLFFVKWLKNGDQF